MAESWGNNNLGKFNEDLVSVPENENILKVSDVNDQGGGDNKIALHTKNSSNAANARAFRAEGKSDFLGIVGVFGNLIVEDDLDVSNKGCVKVNDVEDGEGSGDNKIALHTKNSSNAANARAFRAEGKSDFLGVLKVTDNLHVDGDIYSSSKLYQIDEVLLGQAPNGGPAIPAKIDAMGDPPDGPLDLQLGTQNATNDVIVSHSGQTTTIQGKLEVDEGIANFKVGPSDAAGEIDSGGTEGTPQDLKIGTGVGTDEVIIARENQLTITQGRLRVGRDIAGVHGRSKIDAYTPPGHGWSSHLRIGTEEDTDNVYISRSAQGIRTIIQSELRVGPVGEDGNVDAHEDLYLGSLETNDVIISRQNQSTKVQGSLQVDGNVDFDGALQVGPAADAGEIDAGGTPNAQKLKIGTSEQTDDIIIGRAGQTIDMFGQVRMNSNGIVMDNSVDVLTGNGMIFNPDGHPGPLEPCIDFYINGAVVGYVDANGWNNA